MNNLSDLEEINLDPDRSPRSCANLRKGTGAAFMSMIARHRAPPWRQSLRSMKMLQGRRKKKALIEGRKAP